jgi:hypothetical protein
MLKVVHDVEASHESAGGSLLDEIVRDGARQMLAAALQAEVAAYIEAFADEVDEAGRRLVVRNGHHERREVITAAGAIPVRAPRVNDKRVDPVTGHSSSQHKAAGAQSTRPNLVALVRAGAAFEKGVLVERDDERTPADGHESGGHQQVA